MMKKGVFFCLFLLFACSDAQFKQGPLGEGDIQTVDDYNDRLVSADGDTDTDTDGDSDLDADNDSDTDTDTDADANTEPYTEPNTDADIDSDTNAEGPKSFYTSRVDDGLDPSDLCIMMNGLEDLGYTGLGWNTDVSKEELEILMARNDIGILYHTGHGSDGAILTSTDQLIPQNLEDEINTHTFISATCKTMSDPEWMETMGPSCHNLLGYTDSSLDSADNDVANRFLSGLGSGNSPIRSWYEANIPHATLAERWTGYVREDNEIVEYSAVSENIPARTLPAEPVQLTEKVTVTSALLSDPRTFSAAFSQLTASDYQVTFPDETPSTCLRQDQNNFLVKTPITKSAAISTASEFLSSNPLPGATLTAPIAIQAGVYDAPKITIAYTFRYQKELDNLPVLTNGLAVFYSLLINDNAVAISAKRWPDIAQAAVQRPALCMGLLDLGEAIQNAVLEIDKITKCPIAFVSASPCYGIKDDHLVPAYALQTQNGLSVILDAMTGKLLE